SIGATGDDAAAVPGERVGGEAYAVGRTAFEARDHLAVAANVEDGVIAAIAAAGAVDEAQVPIGRAAAHELCRCRRGQGLGRCEALAAGGQTQLERERAAINWTAPRFRMPPRDAPAVAREASRPGGGAGAGERERPPVRSVYALAGREI